MTCRLGFGWEFTQIRSKHKLVCNAKLSWQRTCSLLLYLTMDQIVYFARAVLLVFAILTAIIGLRFYHVLKSSNEKRRPGRKAGDTCTFAVFLGSGVLSLSYSYPCFFSYSYSGGHTSEALALVSSLDFTRYTPRKYIISEGDTLSARKAEELENSKVSFPIRFPWHTQYN